MRASDAGPSPSSPVVWARPRATAHGGLLDDELAALGIAADDVLDVSVNVNPYGPTPAMIAAVRAARIDRYPDPTSGAARAAVAAHVGCDPAGVVVGNGAVDLLWTLVRGALRPGATVLVVEPTFSELPRAARAAGMRVVGWSADVARDFAVDLDAVADEAVRVRADLLYLCSPGNPTGAPVAARDVARLAAKLPALVVVLDEAFLSLSTRHADGAAPLPENVVRVRSLTKDHAIPGLRVGYALTTPRLAAILEASRPPWSTSAAAQAAVVAAMGEQDFVADSRRRLLADRSRLEARLRDLRLSPHPSSTIFTIVDVSRGGDATALRHRLLSRHAVLIRDCTSFALPHFVRLCARPAHDEARLVRALLQELPT
jgi:histidinol-phosphate/aromatic aminotransferase/cobyric acid decarboxylase-like protein